jgi:hypothetical protein
VVVTHLTIEDCLQETNRREATSNLKHSIQLLGIVLKNGKGDNVFSTNKTKTCTDDLNQLKLVQTSVQTTNKKDNNK